MALTDILEKIKKEAEAKIAKIEQDFEEKKKNLEKENEILRKKIDEDMHEKVEEKSKKIIEKAENLAEREAKNRLLEAKRTIINEVLDTAIDKLCDSNEYEEILVNLLKNSKIEDENAVVMPAKGKEAATKNAIKACGKHFFLSEKSSSIKGGFVIKTDKIEVNNSFETIIKSQLQGELEIKLHNLMF